MPRPQLTDPNLWGGPGRPSPAGPVLAPAWPATDIGWPLPPLRRRPGLSALVDSRRTVAAAGHHEGSGRLRGHHRLPRALPCSSAIESVRQPAVLRRSLHDRLLRAANEPNTAFEVTGFCSAWSERPTRSPRTRVPSRFLTRPFFNVNTSSRSFPRSWPVLALSTGSDCRR